MTEKEIVQALRCCADHSCNAKCPAFPAGLDCREEMHKEVLALLERLTAENADLHKELEWKDMVITLAQKEHAKAESECKALINELCQYCGKYKCAHDGACDGCRWKGET